MPAILLYSLMMRPTCSSIIFSSSGGCSGSTAKWQQGHGRQLRFDACLGPTPRRSLGLRLLHCLLLPPLHEACSGHLQACMVSCRVYRGAGVKALLKVARSLYSRTSACKGTSMCKQQHGSFGCGCLQEHHLMVVLFLSSSSSSSRRHRRRHRQPRHHLRLPQLPTCLGSSPACRLARSQMAWFTAAAVAVAVVVAASASLLQHACRLPLPPGHSGDSALLHLVAAGHQGLQAVGAFSPWRSSSSSSKTRRTRCSRRCRSNTLLPRQALACSRPFLASDHCHRTLLVVLRREEEEEEEEAVSTIRTAAPAAAWVVVGLVLPTTQARCTRGRCRCMPGKPRGQC